MAFSNYVRTGPFTNGSAPGISAAFLNAIEAEFERNSGDTEAGKYYLSGWSNASGDLIQTWVNTISRTSVPVSVSIDTTITSATNVAAPSTGHNVAGGFQVFTTSSSAQVSNLQVGGAWTVTY